MSSGRLQEVKNNGKSLTIRPKKWSQSLTEGVPFTRGSNCRALTDKNLVFWISSQLWEVVPHKRWLHMEVRLYLKLKILPPLRLKGEDKK